MLTMRQLLIAADNTFSSPLSARHLLTNSKGQPLSIRRWISAYEIQRRMYFIRLMSPDVLFSSNVNTFDELMLRLTGELGPPTLGQPTPESIKALAEYLRKQGILLRFVEKDFQRAAVIGTVQSF